ncbi:MAG: HPr family phosphocarrier protein [Elusimicrobiota bacterium]
MIEKRFTVTTRLGLHARPASLFVQAGARYQCSVRVIKRQDGEDIAVNGKSIMGLMLLAAACGEEVKVRLDGPDEEEAMREFADMFARRFDEE